MSPAPPAPGGSDAAVAPPQAVEKVVLPVARAEPIPVPSLSRADLRRMFPMFKHEPYEKAGFHHLTLPFLYTSADAEGGPEEALASSFLLSNSLDWAPGGYCARHAYFTFKRAQRRMTLLATHYDPASIAAEIRNWEATHAVGGFVRRLGGNYRGELWIYGRDGRRVFEKAYTHPRPYFTLLGDMAVDAITFFSGAPSPALAKHLHRQRCVHFESILDLGAAAFAPEKSTREFGLYERILARDPGFADVRWWYANQRQWSDGDKRRFAAETRRSLEDYLVETAVVELDAADRPRPDDPGWKGGDLLGRMEELVGPDFPDLIRMRLEIASRKTAIEAEFLDRATRVAAKFPNSHWLLYQLAETYAGGNDLPADCDMTASIMLAVVDNLFLPSSVDKNHELGKLVSFLHFMGRSDLGIAAGLPEYEKARRDPTASDVDVLAQFLGLALDGAGRFAEAVQVFSRAEKGYAGRGYPVFSVRMAFMKGRAAALAGDRAILKDTIDLRREALEKADFLFLLEGYRDLLDGKRVDPDALAGRAKGKDQSIVWEADILSAQADLLAGQRRWLGYVRWWVVHMPSARHFRILYDVYQRQEPSADDACFYEMLDWLYSHDPWARQAVADFRERAARSSLPPPWPPEKVADLLKDFRTDRYPVAEDALKGKATTVLGELPPGAVEAALRTLINQGRFDEAEAMALRHHHLSVNAQEVFRRFHANHLVYLVRQAREKAASPSPSPPQPLRLPPLAPLADRTTDPP